MFEKVFTKTRTFHVFIIFIYLSTNKASRRVHGLKEKQFSQK